MARLRKISRNYTFKKKIKRHQESAVEISGSVSTAEKINADSGERPSCFRCYLKATKSIKKGRRPFK